VIDVDPKHPLRSKTIGFGFMVVVLGITELVQTQLPVLLVDIGPKPGAWITLAIGATVILLRFVTKGPLSWSQQDPDDAPPAAPATSMSDVDAERR
jgi:hypothetical protein